MIYIMAHKSFEAPKLEGYAPLQVGAALHEDLGWLRDDEGENISAKNPYFCELTGLYWVWKNCDDEIKGLTHYRRYFTRSPFTGNFDGILPFEAIEKALTKADVLVPTIKYNHIGNREQLLKSGKVKARYLDALRGQVERRCPEYLAEFDRSMGGNTGYYMNMMVARREVFDGYCAWLFDLLFALEEEIGSRWPEDDPQRLYGYLSERLLNVYIAKHGLRTAERPVTNLDLSAYWRWRLFRRNYTNRLKYFVWRRKHKAQQ